MIDNNEYENLVKAGYIEAGTLVIKVDDITRIELSPEEIKAAASKQGARQDKAVVLIDKQGRMKKLSSLMFGYNKGQVQLADGSFANSDDLLAAMEAALNSLEEGSIVVDRKGKPINPQDLIRVVEEAAGKVKIGERSPKFPNQEARQWSVEGANSDVDHKKGVVFLGKDGAELKPGEYVSVDELMAAIAEYVIMKPKPEEVPDEDGIPGDDEDKDKDKEPTSVRVTKKYKNKLSRWLIMLMILATLLSGFRIKDKVVTVEEDVEVERIVMHMTEQQQLSFEVDGVTYELTYETLEEAQKRMATEYKIGEEVVLQDGDTLYENSMLGGQKAVIGSGLRQAGNYAISGVSIVYNGRVFSFYADLDVSNPGYDIGAFINKTCEENNLDLDDVQIRLHIGNTSDNTRTGWIDITELIKEDQVEKQVESQEMVVTANYDGVQENFNGSTIEIDTANGKVTLNVVDANGNLLAPGSIVVGSDGKEYQIGSLNLSTIEVMQEQTVTETVTQEKEVVDGKKLTWSIQDCSLAVGIAPLVGAIAAEVATRKKNEESQKLPLLFEFEDDRDYQRFKTEFKEAKVKYEKSSNFGRMLKRIFFREEYHIMQNLTEEQVQEIYRTVRTMNNEAYRYTEGDRVEFRNGRIIIITKDNMMQDITEQVLPKIAHIGKDNPVEEEGLIIPEEYQDGLRK